MRERRLLFVDAGSLHAYCWHAGAIRLEARFAPGAAGIAEFDHYLEGLPRTRFSILAELADEGFQVDAIPYVRGADRRALLERKLGQYYYGTAYSLALPLGREQTGRRDEKLLFAGLTRPQLLDPWLSALKAREAEIEGIYSLPLLVAPLLAKLAPAYLRPDGAPLLIVALTSGGLRQTFVDQGKLRFSRLSPLPAGDIAQAPAACAIETASIHQYLLRQRLLPRGKPLSVLVLAHAAAEPCFRRHCHDVEELRFQYIELGDAARRFRLKNALPQDGRSELLFLQLLATKAPLPQFAPASLRRPYRLGQLRLAWKSAGGAIFAASLVLAAAEFVAYGQLIEETRDIRLAAERDRARYAGVLQTLPPMPGSAADLRALIGRYDELESRAALPWPLYQALSQALAPASAIELNRIDWRAETMPDRAGGSSDASRAADGGATQNLVTAAIHGEVRLPERQNQRATLAAIESFAEELRRSGAWQVQAEKLPFDIESGKALKSSIDSRPADQPAGFVLRLAEAKSRP